MVPSARRGRVADDDVGRVVDPMIVDGRTHGGIARGAGQAPMENRACDAPSGQLPAGSPMDYAVPLGDWHG